MKKTLPLVIGAIAVAATISYFAFHTKASTARAVVLITVDTLRADRVSAYGYKGSRTSAIDRLAGEGALFSTVYCDVPWTTGSMASVMTGLYSPVHGLQFPWLRLPETRVTLAEILKAHGFVTGAVIGNFTVDSVYGLNQGFDFYDDELTAPSLIDPNAKKVEDVQVDLSGGPLAQRANIREKMRNDAYRPDGELTTAAIRWLEQRSSEQFFLWLHYFGPHERLFVGQGQQRQRIIRDYDHDLANTDRAVGRLLKALDRLGLTDRTLVIFHSDHGQALGEHGLVGHGRDLYEATVRTPLIVRYPPRIKPGRRIGVAARNIDILPTVLDYMGIDRPGWLQGRSLGPVLEGGNLPPAPAFMQVALTMPIPLTIPGVGEFFGSTAARGLRDRKWKYIRTTLAAPCFRGATRYSYGLTGINPSVPIGAKKVPDKDCAKYSVEALYDVGNGGPNLSPEKQNLAKRFPKLTAQMRSTVERIAANRGRAEEFELNAGQKAKLKSLGYLN